VLCIQ
jgi:hypothetical protein